MGSIIEIKNLTKTYQKNARGVIDLNLQVNQGDIFGFIGPNGAGKSTTIRTMLGYIFPTNGESRVFDYDSSKDHVEILKRVGYMPSEAMFYRNMKVKDLVKYSSNLRNKDCSNEVDRLYKLFEVDTEKKVNELSLGNRKKVSLICALQHEPELYILDEPTSGLDPLMQNKFWQELLARHEKGATIFVSSHVLSEVKRYCKNAAIIKEGRIIVEDSIENLTKTQAKKILISGINEFDIDNVSNVHKTDNTISFLYNGNLKVLLDKINQYTITDLNITEPDLDEIFMHYYESEEQ